MIDLMKMKSLDSETFIFKCTEITKCSQLSHYRLRLGIDLTYREWLELITILSSTV